MDNDNKLIKRTVVVFEHEISLKQFPKMIQLSETELSEFLNTAVVEMFQLKKMEEKINKNGTGSFVRIKEVI